MKRHLSLRQLSVDHHHVLVHAHRLQKAAANNDPTLPGVIGAFIDFWNALANLHFREEDEVLLPYFARYGDVSVEPIRQMQQDHILIRRDVSLLIAAPVPDLAIIQSLGERLESHVHLEERQVFPLMESAIPDEALSALGVVLDSWTGHGNP